MCQLDEQQPRCRQWDKFLHKNKRTNKQTLIKRKEWKLKQHLRSFSPRHARQSATKPCLQFLTVPHNQKYVDRISNIKQNQTLGRDLVESGAAAQSIKNRFKRGFICSFFFNVCFLTGVVTQVLEWSYTKPEAPAATTWTTFKNRWGRFVFFVQKIFNR